MSFSIPAGSSFLTDISRSRSLLEIFFIMISLRLLSILSISLSLNPTTQQLSLPMAEYRHEIVYPKEYATLHQSATFPEFLPLSEDDEIPSGLDFEQAGILQTPALPAVNLFTPNYEQQPAETPGQMANYIKALEEEAKEAEKQVNAVSMVFPEEIGFKEEPKGYVSVSVGGKGAKLYDYTYTL